MAADKKVPIMSISWVPSLWRDSHLTLVKIDCTSVAFLYNTLLILDVFNNNDLIPSI